MSHLNVGRGREEKSNEGLFYLRGRRGRVADDKEKLVMVPLHVNNVNRVRLLFVTSDPLRLNREFQLKKQCSKSDLKEGYDEISDWGLL